MYEVAISIRDAPINKLANISITDISAIQTTDTDPNANTILIK